MNASQKYVTYIGALSLIAGIFALAEISPDDAQKRTYALKNAIINAIAQSGSGEAGASDMQNTLFLLKFNAMGLQNYVMCIIPGEKDKYAKYRALEPGYNRQARGDILIRDNEKPCADLLRKNYSSILIDTEKTVFNPKELGSPKNIFVYTIDIAPNNPVKAYIVTASSPGPIDAFIASLNK